MFSVTWQIIKKLSVYLFPVCTVIYNIGPFNGGQIAGTYDDGPGAVRISDAKIGGYRQKGSVIVPMENVRIVEGVNGGVS